MQSVSVETLEKGILVNVHSGRSCPGLLVLILATFEELGLNVLEARVSCADTFHLQALGGEVKINFPLNSNQNTIYSYIFSFTFDFRVLNISTV